MICFIDCMTLETVKILLRILIKSRCTIQLEILIPKGMDGVFHFFIYDKCVIKTPILDQIRIITLIKKIKKIAFSKFHLLSIRLSIFVENSAIVKSKICILKQISNWFLICVIKELPWEINNKITKWLAFSFFSCWKRGWIRYLQMVNRKQ